MVVLAGCTGSSGEALVASPPPTSVAPPPAPEPTVTINEGVIRGSVTDDELVPIVGVNISVEKQLLFALTDDSGAFTINLVPPGTQTVVVQLPGYTSAAKRVEVIAGAVAWANFTLSSVARTAFYVDVVPKTALIDVGQFQVENTLLRAVGLGCQGCMIPFELGNDYRQFRAEYSFDASPDYPQVDEVLCYHLYRNTTNPYPQTVTDEYIDTQCIADRGNVTYATPTTLYTPTDQITWYVTPDKMPCYQQRLEMWFSISHNGDLPAGYTALPPV